MATSREDVAIELKNLLVERYSVAREEITPDAHLFEDLGLDSMDLLGAIAILEERHGVKIPDGELAEMLVVERCVDKVSQYLASV